MNAKSANHGAVFRSSALRIEFAAASGIMGIALLLACPGCRQNFANENDTLRARVLDLESQVEGLTHRNAELEAQVKAASTSPGTLPEDIRLNTPQVAEVSLERLSFARDADADGRPESLMLYLQSVDGLGRFVQMVGSLDVVAAAVPIKGEPVRIGQASLGPAEVRQAYRSGLTGTHYTVEVPIALHDAAAEQSCVVRIEFHDGLTGRTMTAERTIPLK